jgi:hypothetical protein
MFKTLRRDPLLVLSQVARDPLDALTALQEKVFSRLEPENEVLYNADPDWEANLHDLLDMRAAPTLEGFWSSWGQAIESLRTRGIKVGPCSFHQWNDGDAGFVRAIWCLIRHLRPDIVVETGVAHGMTSRFILEALELNHVGRLWSIDLPPVDPQTRAEVGIAIDDNRLRNRWKYIAGTSRRRLPALLSHLGRVDLFIHDSLHSKRNVMFELELAWRHLSPGGAIVVDDIDANPAFKMFTDLHPEHPLFVCTAEPLSPDMRRFNQKGLFGIICKKVSSHDLSKIAP